MDRLIGLIKKFNNPCVVGLDTKLSFIPDYIKKKAIEKYLNTPKAAAFAIYYFNKKIIDSIKDFVPAIKLQMAFYEAFGVHGFSALEKTAKYAKENGLYVIFDGKRNDIFSSMESYSKAYLGETELFNDKKFSAFCCDSLTINPYLGSDTIKAVLKDCEKFEKTVFVLVKTSNPSSNELQSIKSKENKFVFEKIAEICQELGKNSIGKFGFFKIGAVVGATQKNELKFLRENFKNIFFLIPGYGAQKADAKDIASAFKNKLGAIVNSSRKILTAWQQNKANEKDFAKCAREEAKKMQKEINSLI